MIKTFIVSVTEDGLIKAIDALTENQYDITGLSNAQIIQALLEDSTFGADVFTVKEL